MTMTDVDGNEVVTENIYEGTKPDENPESITQKPSFQMGLSPAGKIGINITDANGQTAGYIVETPTEAWEIAGHLQAIATMMVTSFYAAAQQEQAMIQQLMAEGAKGKIWHPPGK